MKYQHERFSVMPGADEAYRNEFDRIFRGEANSTSTQVNTESEATSPPEQSSVDCEAPVHNPDEGGES
jgi:hypothetical protein